MSVGVQFLLPLLSLLSEEFCSVICFKLSNLIPKVPLPEAWRGAEEKQSYARKQPPFKFSSGCYMSAA